MTGISVTEEMLERYELRGKFKNIDPAWGGATLGDGMLREALLLVVDAMRDWIVPDGISGDEFALRTVAALDNPKINPIIRELENGRS